jgi:hypothetical protein
LEEKESTVKMNNATCVLFDTVHGCRTTLVRGTRAEVEEYARRYVLWNATWVPVRGAMPELVQLHEDVSVRIQDEGTSPVLWQNKTARLVLGIGEARQVEK